MNKLGMILTLGIVLLCIGMKFDSIAMSSRNRTTAETKIALLQEQIKKIDATILKKEQELESASHIEEFAFAKELPALRKKQTELRKKQAEIYQKIISNELPASEVMIPVTCSLRKKFIEFVNLNTTKTWQHVDLWGWSPDVNKLATIGSRDHTAKIWDATTGAELFNLQQAANWVIWSPDGSKLAIIPYSGAGVEIWDAATGAQVGPNLQHAGYMYRAKWSPDGSKLATIGLNAYIASIWDAATGVQIGPNLCHWVNSVAWSPDGSKLVTTEFEDGTAKIWDTVTGARLFNLHHGNWYWYRFFLPLDNRVNKVVWSPDGSKLATSSNDHTARIWDAVTGAQLSNLRHGGGVVSVAWNPDGSKLATGSWDKTAKIWNAATGELLFNLQYGDMVYSVAWSRDGSKLATGSRNHTAKIWNAATGTLLFNLPHDAAVDTVQWSPDGNKLATGSGDSITRDYTVRIWDIPTQEFLARPLNIDQCELLQAFDIMVARTEFRKPLAPIQATEEQWYTFTTFPKAMCDALRSFIQEPTRTHPPRLEKSKRQEMDKRINKALEQMWEREATAK